ncbi:MAG: GNAT family N-acetyltransferase [Bacteroidales bacterium]|nr:GNAT family N-acetyltransferase [Bacteroidales bacterium]
MIQFTELDQSGEQHFAKELFESAFPRKERPAFSQLKKRENANFHFLIASLDKEEPIGILTYWEFEEFLYIEHFAITPNMRNQGFGKAVILNFLMQHQEQVILETECPTTEQADHRMEFYTDLGFIRNPQEYWQPSYNEDGTMALQMIIMSRYELDEEEFEAVRACLYANVYHTTQK